MITPAMNDRVLQDRYLPMDHSALLARVTGRSESLFREDLLAHDADIRRRVAGRRVLVTGAAGSIGAATVNQVIACEPALLIAIDLSENNLVELVRDIRSRVDGRLADALRTHVVDFGSHLGEQLVEQLGPFDLVLHFAAMKHVRSERDVFSLARLIDTNVLAVDRFLSAIKRFSPCDVFAISSDKACRPASLMGASKRLMEEVVFWHAGHPGSLTGTGEGSDLPRVACTRFANVAFSDGSLLGGYMNRIRKRQPLAGPTDVRRYFITEEEAGHLCLMTAALAGNQQIFVPRLNPSLDLKGFDQIATLIVEACGYTPRWYGSEEEARRFVERDLGQGHYPCCFRASDTSGEKDIEEFVAPDERRTQSEFKAIEVIGEAPGVDPATLREVMRCLKKEVERPCDKEGKRHMAELITLAVPAFCHMETGRDLDRKM
jgi:nucleoside-diphosphate-sugar epimerase